MADAYSLDGLEKVWKQIAKAGPALLYALRHGEDEKDDVIGGWDDPSIDTQGVRDAKEAGEFLKGRGINRIYCSDMERTMETAEIVAKILGIDRIIQDFRLRTWDKGYLNGEPKTDENKETLGYYKDHPHLTIKDGESRVLFENRCEEFFNFILEEIEELAKANVHIVPLIVTHNSNIKQLQIFCDENQIDTPDSVAPGGAAKVYKDKKNDFVCEVILKDIGPNSPTMGHGR
jgi:alpha-ribazole phosphatase